MRGMKGLALVCSALILLNQVPVSVVQTLAAEENEIKKITLESDFINSIIICDKVYDGTKNADADYSGIELIGVENGDSVSLTADAYFTDINAGTDKSIIISDFKLIGENKDEYVLDLTAEQKSVNSSASILPATIYLNPVGSFVEDERLPKVIDYTYDNKNIVNNDHVDIKAKVSIDKSAEGSYVYVINDPSLTGNKNYLLAITDEIAPLPSEPLAAAFSKAVITPVKASVVKQLDFGIIANDSVKITVYADVNYDMPVKFTLSDGQEATDTSPVFNQQNNNYTTKAEFIIELDENSKSKEIDLSCKIENGNKETEVDLPLKLKDDSSAVSNLIIDKKDPAVLSLTLKNHGKENERFFDAKGIFTDYESGISSIRYRWDNDIKASDWIEYSASSGIPGEEIDFNIRTNWSDSVDPRSKRPNGSHKLELEITDNAGNVYRDSGNLITDGADTQPPKATYIRLDKTTETTWDKIVNVLSFGAFVNQKLVLSLKVEDRSETIQSSGIKSVALTDGNDNNARIISELKSNDGKYQYTVQPNTTIEKWYVKLTDENGNTEYFSIRQLLNSDIAKEIVDEIVILEDDATEPTTADNMDWSKLSSDKWIFDSTKPEIVFNCESAFKEDGVIYFNQSGGILDVKIKDNGSLKTVRITESYKEKDSDEAVSQTYKSENFSAVTLNKDYEINTSDLKTGWYTYTVYAYDFAGNPESVKSIQIYVDHQIPEGKISVASQTNMNYKAEDDDDWVREKDESGKYIPIIFRLNAVQTGAKLSKVYMNVSGKNGQVKQFVFDVNSNQIIEENGEYYVTAVISTDPSSSNYLPFSDNNTYEVSAYIEAASHNKSEEISYTLHVDTKNPIVECFIAEEKNSAAEKILNVLTFGVFANNSLKFTVKVKDGDNDIGIDHVDIAFTDTDGKYKTAAMIKNGDDTYYYNLNYDMKIFQSDIVVSAYDKIGKKSENAPNIQNTIGDKKTNAGNTFIMIERNAPSLVVKLPESDSLERNDNTIWYRKHTNSETDSEKYIEVIVQDKDSGIKQINMLINGLPVDHIVSDKQPNLSAATFERDGKKLIDYEYSSTVGEKDRKELCGEFHYLYSIESIAEKIQANADGSYIIEFEIIDNAGNVATTPLDENIKEYNDDKVVYYRDTTLPEIEQFIFSPASVDNISQINQNEFIQKLEYGYYFKTSFDVMLVSNDNEPSSGLDYAIFRLVPYENGTIQEEIISSPVPITDGTAKYTVPAGFKGQIYGKTFDKVNNSSDEHTPQGFIIDEKAPTINIEPLPDNASGKDKNGNNIYTDAVQFKVTISDTQSGLRTIAYSKSSELDSFGEIVSEIPNDTGFNGMNVLDNGWEITATDANLVTEVSKIFTFDKDDNDICLMFKAKDRSNNECETKSSDVFTIDTIAPQISISNNTNMMNDLYYNGSTEFSIKVVERNFSEELISGNIKNDFTNASPSIAFTADENNKSIHTAKVSFPEGDYSFSLSGSDLGGHRAVISYNGGEASEYFFTSFNVDTTKPKIKTNFKEFGKDNDEGVFFNKNQTAEIIVTEHNFMDSDMGISVKSKFSGSAHISTGNDWNEIGYKADWKHEGDKHTLKIVFSNDGVYRISMSPKDRAGNQGEFEKDSSDHTTVFELDTKAPTYEKRNNTTSSEEGFVKTPFYDVYDEKRKDEAAPTVEFDDVNFDRIEVNAIIYTPVYENGKELGEIVMSPKSKDLSKSVTTNKFSLTDFDKDGVYSLTFVAVDKAGNKSEPINNTYFRMIDTDVLAYIYNSKIGDKKSNASNSKPTGYYSLMNADGKAISKKATDFEDLDILVIKPVSDKQAGTLVLREDEKQYSPYDYNAFIIDEEAISETATMLKMHLPGEYFSETFRDDGLNTRMYLSVSVRDDVYLDLASIHIDNEAPTAVVPEKFKNWHNYFFESEQVITISDISELLDDEKSKVYECPRNGKRVEIPHTYDPESGAFSFTLSKGVHHIDISLVDEAGNEWNINRVKYVRVGNFRLYLVGSIFLGIAALSAIFFVKKRRKR